MSNEQSRLIPVAGVVFAVALSLGFLSCRAAPAATKSVETRVTRSQNAANPRPTAAVIADTPLPALPAFPAPPTRTLPAEPTAEAPAGAIAVPPTPLPSAEPTAGALAGAIAVPPTPLPVKVPSSVGLSDDVGLRIDALMRQDISSRLFPSAVLLVARDGAIVKHQAYGYAALYASKDKLLEKPVPATVETIYDIASLSKLFTATAVMILVERGDVDLQAPVAAYVPEFAANGKGRVTVKNLLTHTGGLPAGIGKLGSRDGLREVFAASFNARLQYQPDTKRLYSDIDFIVLGELVDRVSGISLDRFVAAHITSPLGMADTVYQPDAALLPRIAATEDLMPRGMIRGTVHDTVAYHMGGVAGHAGVFSTASDLAILGQMMLNEGQFAGRRILSTQSVAEMTKLQVPASFGDEVGLGWELNQEWYMGALKGGRAFGHTGYSGTSIVINPEQRVVVVLLTNRVHPLAKTKVNSTRSALADIVAGALRSQGG